MSKSTKINISYYISSISLTDLNGEKVEITSKEEFEDFIKNNNNGDFDVCLDYLNRIVYLFSDETDEYEEAGNIVLGDKDNYAFELKYVINTKEKELINMPKEEVYYDFLNNEAYSINEETGEELITDDFDWILLD